MIYIVFNTKEHSMTIKFDGGAIREYQNVTTIKEAQNGYQGYYEVRQRKESIDKNVPIFRVPIPSTIIEYVHG